jgi:hypothetical protein
LHLGLVAEFIVQRDQELSQRLVNDIDAELAPSPALHCIQPRPDRPRSRLELLLAPNAPKEHSPAPLPCAVAKEEKVAVANLVEDLQRNQTLNRARRQVADVVVFGDDEVVAQPQLARSEVRRARRGA